MNEVAQPQPASMRIQIVAADPVSPQARAYAEYRIFAALSQAAKADRVRHARVVLAPAKRAGGCDGVSCTVTVNIDGTDGLRVRATDDHAYAAINNAVDRLTNAFRAFRPSVSEATTDGGDRFRRDPADGLGQG